MKTTKDLIKYNIETAVITGLDKKYKDVKITNGESYAVVMFGLGEYRGLRVKIDNKHKELKKDVLEYGRAIDAEKNRLKDLLEPGENHLKGIRKVWDDEKDRIKEEKEAKERERIEAIQEKINSIRTLGTVHNVPSSAIQDRLILTQGIEVSEEVYMEFGPQAFEAQNKAVEALEEALANRLQFEKEEAERKAEAERLEKKRKELEEAEKKVDEKAAKIAEEHRKLEAEKKAERERLEREELERQNKKEVEKLADKWAKEKADREEAEVKEKERQEALKPDKEKLIKFADTLLQGWCPDVKSAKAKKILSDASDRLDELANEIKEKAKKL